MEKEQGRLAEARDLFERGLKADPINAHLYQAYGQMEAEQKRWRLGLALLQRGIAATGEQDAPLFQLLGRILAWLRRFDQAEVAFHRGLAISPAHAPISQEWAFVKAKEGDREAVESLLRDGCTKCPGDLLHMTLAQFLVSTGRQDDAEPFMKRALKLCGNDQLRRQETERRILLQPFRMGKSPGFRFVALDQERVVEQLVPNSAS
jgi:tetratricopeptide (TPR) repeat protein